MPRCRKIVPASIRAAAVAAYGAGESNQTIGEQYGLHPSTVRRWWLVTQGRVATSLAGLCTVPGCGLPIEGHARCRDCTILLGTGHWNPAGGAYCGYCETRRRRC